MFHNTAAISIKSNFAACKIAIIVNFLYSYVHNCAELWSLQSMRVAEKHPNYSDVGHVYVSSFPIKSCSAKVGLCSTFVEGKTGTPTVLSEQT